MRTATAAAPPPPDQGADRARGQDRARGGRGRSMAPVVTAPPVVDPAAAERSVSALLLALALGLVRRSRP